MKRIVYKIFLFIGCMFFLTGCVAGGIPADEWVAKQYSSLTSIRSYCEKLDDTVALYLSSAITQDIYLSDITELSVQLSEMEKERLDVQIKPGTFTEITMKAKEGYDDIWVSLDTLVNTIGLDNTVFENKDALSYLYLAYQEQLQIDLEKFMAGYNEATGGEK